MNRSDSRRVERLQRKKDLPQRLRRDTSNVSH